MKEERIKEERMKEERIKERKEVFMALFVKWFTISFHDR